MIGRYSIGIEIGGTVLRMGVIHESGAIVRSARRPSADLYDQSTAAERVVAHLHEFLSESGVGLTDCEGIGIGAAGYVDNESRKMIVASNLGWRDYPLGQAVEDLTQPRVLVDKDTNMAGLGELAAGTGRGLDSFIYATLGTGVGGAIIYQRRLLRGQFNSGGDFGHVYAGGDRQCGCGFRGCLERVAGGVSIAQQAREAILGGAGSRMADLANGDLDAITAQTVAEAAACGDHAALDILSAAGKAVGVALVNIIRMVGPQAVILGGSLSRVSTLFESIRSHVELNSVFPGTEVPPVRVLHAALDDSGAIIGSGLAVFGWGQ